MNNKNQVTRIDLSQYRMSGEGANGASYDHLQDPSIMVKLYNTSYDTSTIFDELEVARKVYELGVPSPKPGEMVTDGERIGIRFQRVVGKRSFARALADEPERVEEYAREMASYCKKLHSIHCPAGMFPDAKSQFIHLVEADRIFTPEQRGVICDFIRTVPDSDCAIHGDMHMGNLLTTLPKGSPLSDPHDVLFIDLGYFSSGWPLFDLGMLYMICIVSDDEFRYDQIHVHGDLTARFWDFFVDEYFFGEERLAEKYFGPGATPSTVVRGLQPFVACKCFLVEYNLCGQLPPHYEKAVREAFGF